MKKIYVLLIAFCAITSAQAATITSVASNAAFLLWSDPATWSGGNVPGVNDIVIISSVSPPIEVFTNVSCASLTVNGNLKFLSTITFTVADDLTIANGGAFTASTSNSTLSIGGSFTNNGSFISTQTTITFTGAGNSSFTSGDNTTLGLIVVNKGTDIISVLDLNLASGASSLNLISGTVKISGVAVPAFNGTSIAANTRLCLNNSSVTVDLNGLTGINGVLQVDAGTANLGTVSGIGSVTINGGTVSCTGSFNINNYAQSAGIITAGTASPSSNTVANTAIFGVSGSFMISGGNIVIQTPSGASSSPIDYNVSASNPTITGGTLTLGSTSTFSSTNNFNIQGTTPTLSLYGGQASRNLPMSATQTGALTVAGDLILPDAQVNSFSLETFSKNGFPLTIKGNSASNPGNINIGANAIFTVNSPATAANPISFTSSFGNQTVTNNGTIGTNGSFGAFTNVGELPSITINNTFSGGTVTMPAGLSLISGTTLTLAKGTLNAGANFGLGTTAAGTFTCIRTDGALTATTVNFGSGVTGKNYTYNGTTTTSMGAELTTATVPSISSLTVNNAQGITLNSDLTITTQINFNNGIIDNSGNHKLIIANTSTNAVTGGSSTAFLNGGTLERQQSNVSSDSYFYPVGTASKFRPVRLVNGAGVSTNTFDVTYNSGAPANTDVSNTGFHVSSVDNWDIHQVPGGTGSFNVSLITDNNAHSGIADRTTVAVGHFDATTMKWNNLPSQTISFNTVGSEITSNGVTSFSPFSFISNSTSNTLPILINSFDVIVTNNNAARLNWNVDATNAAAVYVQHSTNGVQFSDITHYNNGALVSAFTDLNPANGVNYYRLKLVEPGGDFVYSVVKTAKFNAESLLVYPNPATNNIKVNWNNWQVPATITIVNSIGITMYKAIVTGSQQTIDVTKFAVGQYILTHSQGNTVKHMSFVVVR